MIDGLRIDVADAAEQPVLANLLQLYIHDFSELHTGTPRCDLGADGRYHPDIPLADWWRLEGHVPFLVRVHGKLAGFILLNTTTHSGAPADRNVAEFFVVRKYRRSGIGRAAAHTVFSRYPGRWEAAVMRANIGARVFWETTTASHPGVVSVAVSDSNNAAWNGVIFAFTIAPA